MEDVGWFVTGVHAEDDAWPYAFTIGLWHTFGVPELAVFGIEPEIGARILNAICKRVARGESTAGADTMETDGIFIAFRDMNVGWYEPLLGALLWFNQASPWVFPLPVRQCVLRDREERYPWDPGCDEEARDRQPEGWLAPAKARPGVWRDEACG